MKPRFIHVPRMTHLGYLFLLFFWITAALSAGEPTAPGDLAAMCRAAKAEFRPLTAADLQKAKTQLVQAATRLERRFTAAGANGADWKKFIKLDETQKELAREQPDLSVLGKAYERYLTGHEGLGLAPFVEMRESLETYLQVAADLDNPNLQNDYQESMDRLATHLDSYTAKPSSDEALAIERELRWLVATGQAPGPVAAIHQHLARPNCFIQVSGGVIDSGVGGPVDDTRPVTDCILGTQIYATSHTTGETNAATVPNEDFGVVDSFFRGVSNAQSVGYHGPVQIFSSAVTNLAGCKRLWVNAEGLHSMPTASSAVSKNTICDIRSNRGRQMVERMAWKRAGKQAGEAQDIASRHAQWRLGAQMDQEGAGMLDRANQAFSDKFRNPLVQRRLFPQQLNFRTDTSLLRVVSLNAEPAQLAAPSDPPDLAGPHDMTLRIHESMVNNFAASALSGMTLTEATFQSGVVDLLGELPEGLKSQEDQEPWAITYARQKPIFAVFDGNQIKITLRGSRFFKGQESYPGMDVTAVYNIVQTPGVVKAVREEKLQILPPRFARGGVQKMDTQELAIRNLLERRFSRVFREEWLGEGFAFPGKWAKVGKMRPVYLASANGWLTIAWQREAAPQAAGAAVADNR